jgi:hypothetical protein
LVFWDAMFFLQQLCKMITKDSSNQSTESQILFRSCGHETPFTDQKGASKIGDSVLW